MVRKIYYSGIGARKAPKDILSLMYCIAKELSDRGYTLRSGGAVGSDTAFEEGSNNRCTIFSAKDATKEAIALSKMFHPAWDSCSDYAKKLHGRNAQIILGLGLDDPSDFVVCWTPEARKVGGTGNAIRIAESKGIKIFNLAKISDRESIKSQLGIH